MLCLSMEQRRTCFGYLTLFFPSWGKLILHECERSPNHPFHFSLALFLWSWTEADPSSDACSPVLLFWTPIVHNFKKTCSWNKITSDSFVLPLLPLCGLLQGRETGGFASYKAIAVIVKTAGEEALLPKNQAYLCILWLLFNSVGPCMRKCVPFPPVVYLVLQFAYYLQSKLGWEVGEKKRKLKVPLV